MTPRVVFLDHCAQLSGAEIALLNVLPLLRSVRPHVILAEDGPLREELDAAGVACEVLPLADRTRTARRMHVGVGLGAIHQLWDVFACGAAVGQRLAELDARAVHSNSAKSHFYGAVAARRTRLPQIWHFRDRVTEDFYSPLGALALRCGSYLFAYAVVANSSSTLETVPSGRRLGSRREIIASPVHASEYEAREVGPGNDEELTVGMVGRLTEWKGQRLFLEAFAKAFGGTKSRAVIVGAPLFGETVYAEGLVHLAAQLGIAEQVEFRGFRRDVYAELARLDVLVHASLIPEPFGQVIVQGMAAGLTVIAAGEGGPREIIQHGTTGLLYRPRDSDCLASHLIRVSASTREERLAMGRRARAASLDYRPEIIARRLDDFYLAIGVGK